MGLFTNKCFVDSCRFTNVFAECLFSLTTVNQANNLLHALFFTSFTIVVVDSLSLTGMFDSPKPVFTGGSPLRRAHSPDCLVTSLPQHLIQWCEYKLISKSSSYKFGEICHDKASTIFCESFSTSSAFRSDSRPLQVMNHVRPWVFLISFRAGIEYIRKCTSRTSWGPLWADQCSAAVNVFEHAKLRNACSVIGSSNGWFASLADRPPPWLTQCKQNARQINELGAVVTSHRNTFHPHRSTCMHNFVYVFTFVRRELRWVSEFSLFMWRLVVEALLLVFKRSI